MTDKIAHIAPKPRMLAVARRSAIADLLRESGSVTISVLERRFDISAMTARRDLATLEQLGVARRTHGGAVLAAVSAQEDSFASRAATATEAKTALALAAATQVAEGESVFLDSSSTAWHVARALIERGTRMTLITNSLPIMELVAHHAAPSLELIGVGGQLRHLTQSFVGPYAVSTVLGHYADRCFLSVKGVAGDGALTDADPLEAEVKHTMIQHADASILLVDRSKLSARGLNVVGHVNELSGVIAHGVVPERLRDFVALGSVPVEVIYGE